MERHELEKNWTHWKNGIQTHWNKLTSGDIYQIDGMWDHLVTTLVKRYGWSREAAEKEIDNWHPQWSQSMSREENWDQKQAKKGIGHQNEKGRAWDKPKETWDSSHSEGIKKEGKWDQKQANKGTGHQIEKGHAWDKPKETWDSSQSQEIRKEGKWDQKQGKKAANGQKNKVPEKNKPKDSYKEPTGWNEKKRKAG